MNRKPAISDVTKLDLLGERKDGGLDMGIVAEGPLDGSAATLALVEQKVRNYFREATDASFRAQFGGVLLDQIRILFESRFEIDDAVLELLSLLASDASKAGVRFEVRRY